MSSTGGSLRPGRRTTRALLGGLVACALAGTAAVTADAVVERASSIPTTADTTPPATEPPASTTTSTVPLRFQDGLFIAPDGSFSVAFADIPKRVVDAGNGTDSYLRGVDEDTQTVIVYPPTALGAASDTPATQRSELFLAASGTDAEIVANSPTRLGPFEAALFASRLTLVDGRRVVVYGLVVMRPGDVIYVFFTDVDSDDNAAGTAFVQSFTVLMDEPPVPTTTTTTTVTPAIAAEPAGASAVPATTASPATATSASVPDASTTTTLPPATTVLAAPGGATLSFDRRWWIAFPDGVTPSFRASIEDGFGFAEYIAVAGDDTLVVRATEVPANFEWTAIAAAADAAARHGGDVLESDDAVVDGRPAVRITVSEGDGTTSGGTVELLVVDAGDRIYTVGFEDGGETSSDDATAFIDSFGLA